MNRNKFSLYLWLFYINLFISAFTFGGGYVVVPMIRKYFVDKKKLFDEDTLMQMAAIAQSTPGAIAINLSALAGYQTAGFAGAAISCGAAVVPPLIILSIVSVGYAAFSTNIFIAAVLKGMQAGVAALIVDLVVNMFQMILKEKSRLLTIMVPCAFVANFIFHINVAAVLIVCCMLCIGRVWFCKKSQVPRGEQ